MEKPSVKEGVITRVLVGDYRQDRSSQVVFDSGIGEGVPVIAAIAGCSLMKFRIGFGRLFDRRLESDRDERGIIESALGGEPEFLSGR